jgi:tetratricopeptide (TPR) repeat protein
MRIPLAIALIAALSAAGCRTKPPASVVRTPASAGGATNAPVVAAARPAATNAPAAQPPPQPLSSLAKAKAEEATAREQKEKLKEIEKTISDRRAEQERIARQLDALKKEIIESAQSLRDLKLRTDNLSGLQATNATSIAALEKQLEALQTPPAKAMQDLQAQLVREQKEREKTAALAAEKSRELEALKKQQASAPPAAKPAPAPAAPPVAAAKPVTAPAPAQVAQVPPSAYKLVADGNQMLRSGDLAGAENAFTQALAQAPGLTGAKVGLAACRYNMGRIDEALKLAGDVLAVDKRNAQALGIKGIVLWQQGQLKEANQALSEAVRNDPSDSQLHNYLGVVLQARNEPEDALREMRKAVELDKENAEARYNLAVLLATGRRPAMYEARVHYEAALQLGNPRDEAMDKLLYGTTPAPSATP